MSRRLAHTRTGIQIVDRHGKIPCGSGLTISGQGEIAGLDGQWLVAYQIADQMTRAASHGPSKGPVTDVEKQVGDVSRPDDGHTRVALLTGQHQDRFAVGLEEPLEADKPVALPLETPTLPGILRQAGYRTSLIGKWHVGIGGGVGPRDYGYDSFFGFLGGMTDYFSYAHQSSESVIQDNGRNVVSGKYLTQLLGERAALEIAENRNSASPFFLSLHFSAPHSPWQGPTDSELAKPNSEWALMDLDGGNVATYRSTVGALDSAVGQVLAAIESMGEADNTIVIFTSDNGGARFSDNWPLIGVKSELMEGGIRVPIIVRWPGMIQSGLISDQVMTSMDFLPTLAAAAGGAVQLTSIDGVNLLPVLLGQVPPIERSLFWRFKAREQKAVRIGGWKYLEIDGQEYLFNISHDERERADLKGRYPEELEVMRRVHDEWSKDMLPYPLESFSADHSKFLADR